jgi:hypothetical protein
MPGWRNGSAADLKSSAHPLTSFYQTILRSIYRRFSRQSKLRFCLVSQGNSLIFPSSPTLKVQQRQRTVLDSQYSLLFDGFAVSHRASAGVLLARNFQFQWSGFEGGSPHHRLLYVTSRKLVCSHAPIQDRQTSAPTARCVHQKQPVEVFRQLFSTTQHGIQPSLHFSGFPCV